MELNWSTFAFEILNFLVLIWILKRFLYKPIMNVMARRQAAIEKTLREASDLKNDAETLRRQYENRRAVWEGERRAAQEQLTQEIEEERTQRRMEIESALGEEEDKARAAAARRKADVRYKTEAAALDLAARFAARLLQNISSPELETRLVDSIIDELSQLPGETIKTLRESWLDGPESILVTSAYPIIEKQRHELEETLIALAGSSVPIRFEQDEALVAGVRVGIGAWVLSANIEDELKGFADIAHVAPEA